MTEQELAKIEERNRGSTILVAAYARQDVPILLAEVRRLQEEVAIGKRMAQGLVEPLPLALTTV